MELRVEIVSDGFCKVTAPFTDTTAINDMIILAQYARDHPPLDGSSVKEIGASDYSDALNAARA
jgi:hypothetical protein